MLLSFKTRLPFDLLAGVAGPLRSRPVDEQLAVLGDPDRRAAATSRPPSTPTTGLDAASAPRPGRPDFEGIRVYQQGLPPNPSVADVARQRGVHPVEAMIDLCVESDGDQLFIQPSLYPQDEAVLLRAMRHPRTVMTFSDSGAHLSQIADSSIHTHLLGHWVRDRQEFTLEEAVRMITLAPALAWGFTDRGLLREGMVADLNVFDPDDGRPGRAAAGGRPPGRRPPPRAAVGGLPRHGGGRPGDHPGRGAHRGHAGTPAPEPAGLIAACRPAPARGPARYRIQRVRDVATGDRPAARRRGRRRRGSGSRG